MTVAERDALIDLLNLLVKMSFRHASHAEKIEMLEQWRESYEILCSSKCSSDQP